jgi:AcrR family transcriptional regulator
MPIIINKEKKIELICQKAYDEFIKYGIENISLNQLLENLEISKGQFYHYFKTKEDLIFQVMSQKIHEHFIECKKNLEDTNSLSESLITLFSIYINENEYSIKFRKLMFDSLYIYTHTKNEKIKEYNKETYQWIDEQLFEIFNKYEIYQSDIFIKSICATVEGMYMRSLGDETYDLKLNLTNYLSELSNIIYKG